MNEVVIPLKIQGIAQMKAELRELKGELANATDTATMTRLAEKAGELTDKIRDANDAVKVFASGSKFEQVRNGISGIAESLASLDFEEAATKSLVFASALATINKADIAKSIMGIVSTVNTLSKAFIKLGVTILMNPIFLIVAAVVAIIAVIALVLNSFGVLDDVIDALMAPIYILIQGFKDMTDWLGLTAYAAEESAAKSAKAYEDGAVRINEATDLATSAIDRQIAEQKALGKNTYDLEVKRTYIVQWAANNRLKLAREAYYKELALGDAADQEKLKKLKAQIAAEDKLIKDSKSGRQVLINTKFTEDNKPKKVDKPKAEAKPKATKEKPAPKAKDTGGEEIQKEIDKARQANLDSTLDAITVEKNAVEAKYTDLLAKAVKYKKDTSDLEILKKNEINNINLKDAEAKQKVIDEAKEKAKVDAAAAIKLEDEKYLEIQRLTAANEKDKVKQLILTADYEKAVLLAAFDEKVALLKEGDPLLKQLKTELETSLANITKDAKDKELAIVKETEEKKRAEQLKTADAALDYAGQSISAIEGITNLAMENKLKKVKKGSKEEEALLKKQFQLNKSMQLAGAIVDAGKAITASLASSPIAIGPIPNPAGIASLAFAAVTSATNIAKIASTTFTSGTAPSTNTPTPSTTAVAPSGGPNLFGQANTGSQVNAGGGTGQNITVTAIVSETEITASQNHINNIQNNSVL
jgi:hypothetical protein